MNLFSKYFCLLTFMLLLTISIHCNSQNIFIFQSIWYIWSWFEAVAKEWLCLLLRLSLLPKDYDENLCSDFVHTIWQYLSIPPKLFLAHTNIHELMRLIYKKSLTPWYLSLSSSQYFLIKKINIKKEKNNFQALNWRYR